MKNCRIKEKITIGAIGLLLILGLTVGGSFAVFSGQVTNSVKNVFVQAEESEAVAFAVYSETDASLRFYKNSEYTKVLKAQEAGEAYYTNEDGEELVVTEVFTGFETETYTFIDVSIMAEDVLEKIEDDGVMSVNTPWISYSWKVKTVVVEEEIAPVSTAFWFYIFVNCESMNLEKLNTSAVTNMMAMFCAATSLTELDVSNFDTSQVTDMSIMFLMCRSLKNLDLSNFDTAQVITMNAMFQESDELEELDLSSFDTSAVTDMETMFSYCSSLTVLDLSSFDTSQVVNMLEMFYKCYNLEAVYVSELWSTEKVEDGGRMFEQCYNLVGGCGTTYSGSHVDDRYAHIDTYSNPGYLTLGSKMGFAVYSETDDSLRFYYNTDYAQVLAAEVAGESYYTDEDGTELTVTAVFAGFMTDTYCLYQILSVEEIGLTEDFEDESLVEVEGMEPPWMEYAEDVQIVVIEEEMAPLSTAWWFFGFEECVYMDLSKLDTSRCNNMAAMFMNCSQLTELDVRGFDTAQVTDMWAMFCGCQRLSTLDLSGFDTSAVTNMAFMFSRYGKKINGVAELDLTSFDTSSVINMYYMFENCRTLKELDLSSFDTSNVTNMIAMFNTCYNLETIYVSSLWTAENAVVVTVDGDTKLGEGTSIFAGCDSLVGGNGTVYDTANQAIEKEFACIDTEEHPGYLTDIADKGTD